MIPFLVVERQWRSSNASELSWEQEIAPISDVLCFSRQDFVLWRSLLSIPFRSNHNTYSIGLINRLSPGPFACCDPAKLRKKASISLCLRRFQIIRSSRIKNCNFPQTLSSDFCPNPRILFSLFLSPLVHRLSQRRKTEAKTKAMPNRYADLTPLFPIFNSSCPRKTATNWREIVRPPETSMKLLHSVLVFSKTVYLLFSLFLSPLVHRHSQERKTPHKPKHYQKTDTRIPPLLSVVFQFSLLKEKKQTTDNCREAILRPAPPDDFGAAKNGQWVSPPFFLVSCLFRVV